MKRKASYMFIAVIIGLFFASSQSEAQRRVVVRHPSKMVVVKKVPRNHVVYVNRRTVVRQPVLTRIPAPAVRIVHRNVHYHYFGGSFYVSHAGGFVIVAPPSGIVIATLPAHFIRLTVRAHAYYYASGIFYKKTDNGYETVEPPVGAMVEYLPDVAEKVLVDDKVYYEVHDTLYQKVETADGFVYEVTGMVES